MAHPIAGLYRHYKGAHYRVFGVARHSEHEEQLVVYQALYGEFGLWVRPLEMFCGSVEIDGQPVPRFALIEAEAHSAIGGERDSRLTSP